MPVLGKLFGVECARCREAGHRCQAQIVMDELALCLRCADDEPCIYVTAAASAKPVVENSDPCVIPQVTRGDRQAIREMPTLSLARATVGELTPAIRAAIANERKLSANQLAAKYHVSKSIVEGIRFNDRKRRDRALLAAQRVAVSPMAVLGAEIIFGHLEKKH